MGSDRCSEGLSSQVIYGRDQALRGAVIVNGLSSILSGHEQ
jgi:hypothetical protein